MAKGFQFKATVLGEVNSKIKIGGESFGIKHILTCREPLMGKAEEK